MHDYEPLDLGAICNAGLEVFGGERRPAVGAAAQTFHGLPFRIGEGASCLIALGPGSGAISIPVGKAARRVIVAHVLRESRLHEGDAPGRVVARYAFVFADGERIEVPIRERFETAFVPTGWGEMPFLAVPDRKE